MPAPAVGQRLYGTADLGRRTLPARTHLYDAERLGQYVHSLHRSDKSGIYNLNTPVDKVFTVEGENCGESIFELQCEATDA